MGDHLAQAHVGLVTERPACIGTVVPSKVYGLMAAGKPILFVGPRLATPALLIRRFGCGWHVEAGATEELTALLELLSADWDLVRLSGLRAREAFDRNYDLSIGVARVTAALGLSGHVSARPKPAKVRSARATFAARV
jgi:hypothetical protein